MDPVDDPGKQEGTRKSRCSPPTPFNVREKEGRWRPEMVIALGDDLWLLSPLNTVSLACIVVRQALENGARSAVSSRE